MFQANFTVSPSSGFVHATKFTVTNLTSGNPIQQLVWDFGTGDLIYNTFEPTYTYKAPGTFQISLTATDIDNNTSIATSQVVTDLAFRDYVTFTDIPEKFSDPGLKTDTPFKVSVVSSNPDKPITIDLFASNSRSTPYQFITDKWNFLAPTWKFYDKNNNLVTSLSVTPVPIYVNNVVVAVSGTAEFFYVDSTGTDNPVDNCPVLITASLQTSGFSNPQDASFYPYDSHTNNKTVKAGVVWQINNLHPNILKVSSNYVDDIYPVQWNNIKIPVLITAHSNRSLVIPGSEDKISDIIFSYPASNEHGKRSEVNLHFTNLSSSDYNIDENPLYFQATDDNNLNTKGYIFTTVTSKVPISSTSLVASTTAFIDSEQTLTPFSYPYGFAPNTAVWVSNPEQGTLNKITLVPYPNNCKTINHYKDNNILIDGVVKEVSVPTLTSNSTFNYSMSGFSGIYSVAIDPRKYDVVACDAELDRIYKISNTGEILKTVELSGFADYSATKKAFFVWKHRPTFTQLSANNFFLYGSKLVSSNSNNYIVSMGGVIQPASNYSINTDSKELTFTIPDILTNTNVDIDIVQIFNPALPFDYISTIRTWNFTPNVPTTTFNLTGTPTLSASSDYYMVTLDGVVQTPNSYTVDIENQSISFSQAVQPEITLNVLFLPKLVSPVTWYETFSHSTSVFPLTSNPNYIQDPNSDFLVSIGGVYQPALTYTLDFSNQNLIFDSLIPANVPVTVTQVRVQHSIEVPTALTPAYVSLDKDYNAWVTLFNSVSVLKFDKDLNFLFSATPGLVEYHDLDEFESDYLLKPPVVETDMNNNCWVTYAHPLCSTLVHYSSSGRVLQTIQLPQYSTPISLAINAQNNIWVASSYNVLSANGDIRLYSSQTYNLLDTVPDITRPGYLSLDRNNNLWFTHSIRGLGHYNISTKDIYLWKTDSVGEIHIELIKGPNLPIDLHDLPRYFDDDMPEDAKINIYQEDEDFGGLAIDVYNRLWVIDSFNNNAWVFSDASPEFRNERLFKIKPNNTLGYYINLNTGSTYTESKEYNYRSAQAAGDWTGNRWYQKYANPQSTLNIQITGESGLFRVEEFVNKHQIKRVNESFNASQYLKSLALPEILSNNTILFDSFLAAAAGTSYLSANEDPGQVIYERIANYVNNHADIDTCNIDQLLSMAENVAVPASDYAAAYPTDIRNMLDIGSITRSRLWGIKDDVPLLIQSIGPQYNTLTDTITAGSKIILKSKFDSSYSLLSVPPLENGQLIYTIDKFFGYGLIEPITVNYLFYRFVPTYSGNYLENIIDWKSPYTTQSITASTLEEWYGDGQALETAFRYLLTKNLFL